MAFVKFDFKRENMLLHIFRLEAKALPKRPAKRIGGARATALPCRCKRLAVATLWLVVLVVGKTFLHERVGLLKPGVREFFCEFTTGIEGHNN
jgi:hypothetical protein